MDLGKLLNFIITAAIVFAGYKYFSTGDITFVPPNQETVRKLAQPIVDKLPPGTHLTVGQSCARTSGGYIKTGVFTCEINVFSDRSSYAKALRSYKVKVTKENGEWVLVKGWFEIVK